MATRFYLGAHQPGWLWGPQLPPDVPLFVSRVRLATYTTQFPRAHQPWALDSGGFSEIDKYGTWRIDAHTYAKEVRRYYDEIGPMEFASIQDWMCEPQMLKKSGKTIAEHQDLTVRSYLDLMDIDDTLPWIPILQGWTLEDYLDHAGQYERHGVDLEACSIVGLGSVCRRQAMGEAVRIVNALQPLRLHGFGFKTQGLEKCGHLFASADSMAWSAGARNRKLLLPECAIEGRHINCGNCPRWAMKWRARVLETMGTKPVQQMELFNVRRK